jgi:hypothetical protein
MKGKLVFVAGAAVGYVLGARAGRRRYEQIKAGAERLWNDPNVQKGVDEVQGFVKDHTPDVAAAVVDQAKKVAGTVTKRTSSSKTTKPSSGAASTTTGS